tara:strand:- start:6525 stop:7682 length:1158 start_codon:yes stop_codon:yes gene_type:complete
MADAAGVRQDKVRFIVADLETTVGTFLYPDPPSATTALRVPARAESRLAPVDGEMIDNSEALDGYAGAIASTRGAVGMGGVLSTELRANGVTNAYPTHVKQLLASGFEVSAYSDPNVTLIPSTKALTNWPGESVLVGPAGDGTDPGQRSPASMSIVEAMIDNNTKDEWLGAMGGVLATKIMLGTNGLVNYNSTITGQVAGDLFLDVSDTDLSGFGAEPTDQGKDPVVVKGATLVVKYTDADVTDQVITPDRFRNLEIDLAPNIVRVEDPTATNGYAVSPVFYDGAIGVTLQFADSSGYGNSVTGGTIMAGFKSGRGFLSIELTLTLDDSFTVDQTIKYDLPRIQYDAVRENAEGARAFTFTGSAVRAERGNSTSPFTVTYVHGTA